MLGNVRAVVAYGLLTINLVVGTTLVFVLSLLKVICPLAVVSEGVAFAITQLTGYHARNIRRILEVVCGLELQVKIPAAIDLDGCYTLVANHRSLVDILVLIASGVDALPPLKFFLKRSLMYVPFMGLFCYLTGYPFVDRYNKSQLRNPKLRLRQQQNLLDKCKQLFEQPTGLVIFVEGTRYDKLKASRYKYKHLLPPQSMGLALAMDAKREQALLDVTLAYEGAVVTPWRLLSGDIARVVVDYRLVTDVAPVVYQDRKSMVMFHKWLQSLWALKDERLERMYADI